MKGFGNGGNFLCLEFQDSLAMIECYRKSEIEMDSITEWGIERDDWNPTSSRSKLEIATKGNR